MQNIIEHVTGRTRRVVAASLVLGSLMSFAMGQQLAHRTDAALGAVRRPLLQAEHRPLVNGAVGSPLVSMPSHAVRTLPLAALSSAGSTTASSDESRQSDDHDTKHEDAKKPHSYASPEHANPPGGGGNGQGGND